jgi:lipid-binding SYLF domain-containing protein
MNFKKLVSVTAATILATSTLVCAGDDVTAPYKAAAEKIKKEKDQLSVQSALVTMSEAVQLKDYFANCYGCVVFPTIGKGGFGVGGSHGKGWVFRRHRLAGESKMTQITVGFQVGGQVFTQVVFFEDEESYERFTEGNFEFGAQASAAVITEGVNASASTAGGSNAGLGNAQAKTDYTEGMAVFIKTKGGLMYEAAIGGQKFSFKPLE